MAIIAGIDEAGYGPLLGPLVVSGTAFEVPDELVEVSLWKTLKASVRRKANGRDRRLPVADSKTLYSPAVGLKALERTALVMLRAGGSQPSTFRELLTQLAPQALDALGAYGWYSAFDAPLPTMSSAPDVGTRANAVRRDMEAKGVRLAGVYCEPLLEGHFNRLVSTTRNKAVVLMGLTWRIVQRILSCSGDQAVYIHIDRQGGREHYGTQLMICFADHHLRIIEETELSSAYELVRGPARRRVDFTVGGEDHHLPIALASIFSKYVRELFMAAFNAWWAAQVAGLRPTAGYYGDGQRFIRDIAPAVARLGIDRAWLVRSR